MQLISVGWMRGGEKMADNKGRIIFLEHYLLDHADEDHPITTESLIEARAEKGYSANRNTIHSDIEALKAEGIQVAGVRVGNAKGYYVRNRPFRISELKALIDSVSSEEDPPAAELSFCSMSACSMFTCLSDAEFPLPPPALSVSIFAGSASVPVRDSS